MEGVTLCAIGQHAQSARTARPREDRHPASGLRLDRSGFQKSRFLSEEWLKLKEEAGVIFTSEQSAWLQLMRDHIATSLSIEPGDFDYSPFSQRGGLGKAHQVFGADLPRLLDELNEALAA